MNNSWLANASANRLNQSYVQGFVDVSGNVIVRSGSVNIKTGKLYIPQGDISMNGNIISTGVMTLGTTTASGYQMTVNGNARIKNSILVDNDASIMSSLGVGKASNDTYPLDVNGTARFSSNVLVGGDTTISGSSTITGSIGVGANPSEDDKLYVNGQFRAIGQSMFDTSVAIGPEINREGDMNGLTLLVKAPITSTAANDVIMNVPTNLYTSTDITNTAYTNKLQIDTKNHAIKPSIEYDGTPVTDSANGWDLGATGANSFNRVYGRTIEVSKNMGVGKSSDAGYAMDISGATRLSSSLAVGGAVNVTGTTQLTGSVGIGKSSDSNYSIDVSGDSIIRGNTNVTKSLVIGQTELSTSALYVNATSSSAQNSVVLEGANVLFKGQSSANLSHTNFLEIDTKTRSILPYAKTNTGTTLNSMETGWNLGGTGANRFSKIYGRDLEISTNTIKIEDESGNQISMSFDATTGAVNYTVTTISGEVFVIKGVQTQKISSGNGTIDPSMLEFTGLSFGDTFMEDAYDLTSTFTYNLGTTTYTGNGTTFTSSAGTQSLDSFVTGTNLTTLLALVPTGTSVVIKVGATDGRSAYLEGIDVAGSLVSLAGKIISVKKNGSPTVKWTLWNSENYINVAGNYLHYIELKNINMSSGTYFVAKESGTLTYNIVDQQFLKTADLTTVNGDLYLYITRGPGNNWTKIPVSLPQSGSINTQHMANSAITTAKLADNSVTGDKIVDGSITGFKFANNSITTAKIADGNVTSEKLADGSISGTKLAAGAIGSTSMIADGIITGAKLVASSIGSSLLDASAVTTDKIATGAVTADKLGDLSVTASKIADGAITNEKMAVDSITGSNIIGGSITGDKLGYFAIITDNLAPGSVTSTKLEADAVTSTALADSAVIVAKIATGAVETAKIADLAVTTGKLAATSVTTAKIASGAVTADKMAADSIATTNIIDGAITTAKITNYAVTADQIAGSAITTGKVADLAITDVKLNAGSVTSDKIVNDSITTAKIADFSVTTFKLADAAVGTNQIGALAVTSAKIGNLEVSTAKIADGAVTTAKIAAGSITTALLDISAVTTDDIATGAVTTAKIAAGAVTTAKLAASAVETANIADAAVTTAKLNASSVTTSIIADGSITAAKLAPGFTLPSGGGGGASISSTSDISVNSIQVNGKAKFEKLNVFQKISGTSASNIVNVGYSFHQRYNSCRISRTGDTIITIISNAGTSVDGIYVYKYNSTQGNFIFTTKTSVDIQPTFMGISNDGNVVATATSWRFGYSVAHICFLSKTVGSTVTLRMVQLDSGEGTNNIAYFIRGVNVSGDGTKLFVVYSDTGSFYGIPANWGIYVYNVSDLSLLVKIPMQANFPYYSDDSGDTPLRFEVSTDGTRLITSAINYSSNRGRVMVFNITYSQTTSVVAMDVTNNTNPSYGLTGYKPLKLSDLPTRFRLRVNSNQYFVGVSNTTRLMFSYSGMKSLSYTPMTIFTADKPSDLYSATGVDTYRLRATNYAWIDSNTSATNYYLYSNATSDITINSSYSTTLNFAWQFFKNTTTGEIIMWNPSPSGSGNYITYNTNQTAGDSFRLGSGTPIMFTIEPVFDFSSVNTVATIGTFDGTTTTGVTSKYGYRCAISTDGSKIAFSSGDITTNTVANQAVRLYTYVSGTNWTSNQTILASSLTDVAANLIGGFGTDIRFNSTFTEMIVGSICNIGTSVNGYLSVYKLTNGSWVYYKSVNGANLGAADYLNTFGYSVSLSDNGYYVGVDQLTNYGNIYIYKVLRPDLTSNTLSTTSVYTDNLLLSNSNIDFISGTDNTTAYNYSSRNTGTFLNSGNIVIHNPTTPLVPTLTFKTIGSGGVTGAGPIIEFKNSPSTSAWGTGTMYDWRWKFDTYNGYQAMIFEGQYVNSGNYITYRDQFLTLNNREICVGFPISSPVSTPITLTPTSSGTYYGGAFVLTSLGTGGQGITADLNTTGAVRTRFRSVYESSGFFNCYLQTEGEFDIQTGRSASTVITTANVLSNRRLHISRSGDVGIGTSAVTGTKLTVDGDLNVTGYVASTKAVPMSFLFNTSFTGPGTASDMCKSMMARTFLSKDGNVVIAASPTAKTVYVYRRTAGVWNTTATTITKTDTGFAKYVAMSKDGTVIASSNGTTIWIYRWSGSAWTLQTQTLVNATYGANYVKNMKLSLDGGRILVCSYISTTTSDISIYNTVTGSSVASIGNMFTNDQMDMPWTMFDQTSAAGSMGFGGTYAPFYQYTLEMSEDTNTVILSISSGPTVANNNRFGKVVVYDINYATTLATRVSSYTGTVGGYDYFGKRVAVNQDGTVIAFSAGEIQNYNFTASKARVFIYSRTAGSSSWTLSKIYNDIDANIGLAGFGHELSLNSSGTRIYIGSTTHQWSGSTTTGSALSMGFYSNGSWSSTLSNLIGVSGSFWGDTISSDDAGNIAVTEINNTVTPHGGRINLYSLNLPPNNVQTYGSVIMKTGTGLTDRMTIDGDGFIGIGTAPVSGTALTISGSVNASGSVTGASDDRLKENEVLVANATETLLKLRPEIYDKKPDFVSTDPSAWQKETGLIAQDLWYGAPELRHLVKLGTHTDVQVCDYEPIIYPPLVSGIDVSGVEFVTVTLPFKTDASGNLIDLSGNLMQLDASGNPVDASGNQLIPSTEVIMVDTRPKSKCVLKTVNTPVNPADIVDIPVAPNIQVDPDYTALGWGDTPASVNYIGLIPYLIKSIQELKAEIEVLKSK